MRTERSGVLSRAANRVRRWSIRAQDRVRSLPIRAAHRGHGIPLPPPNLVHLVAGTENVAWYLEAGALGASCLRSVMAKNGGELESLQDILDFGCGSGRVLRHFHDLKGPQLHGTDYNPALVRWCEKNLPFVKFQVNTLEAKLAYPDESFDLIYALSVFTHLSEPSQALWMQELKRILRPGGYLFFTTHGDHYLPQLTDEDRQRFAQGQLVVVRSKREGSNDCATFHPPVYVRQTLSQGFEIVDFLPEGALGNPRQDVNLFRKPRA